jgi:hypothetical protein
VVGHGIDLSTVIDLIALTVFVSQKGAGHCLSTGPHFGGMILVPAVRHLCLIRVPNPSAAQSDSKEGHQPAK